MQMLPTRCRTPVAIRCTAAIPVTARAGRWWAATLVVVAIGGTSCAASQRLIVPAGYAAANAGQWPPLGVDGYTTTDGTHHPLPGGHMMAIGDSVVFAPSSAPQSILAPARRAPVCLHADSVKSVDVRLENAAGSDAGNAVGAVIAVALVAGLLFYASILPWAYAWH